MMINKVATDEKMIAITFDDGPNPIFTPEIFKILHEANAKATFFMIGEQMEKSPELVKVLSEQGHEIGNHTYHHMNLTELSEEECLKEIKENEEYIQKLTGKKPKVLRPPFLAQNESTNLLISNLGYSIIGALNMDATDWEMPGVDFILRQTRKHVQNGAILIFHDGYDDRNQTIEAVRQLVPELQRQSYKLVTVSELLERSYSRGNLPL